MSDDLYANRRLDTGVHNDKHCPPGTHLNQSNHCQDYNGGTPYRRNRHDKRQAILRPTTANRTDQIKHRG